MVKLILIFLGVILIVLPYYFYYVIQAGSIVVLGRETTYTNDDVERFCSRVDNFLSNFGLQLSTQRCNDTKNLQIITWVSMIGGGALIVFGLIYKRHTKTNVN